MTLLRPYKNNLHCFRPQWGEASICGSQRDFIVFIDCHFFCRMARTRGALFFLLLAVVIGKFCLAENEVKECINGSYHKDKPSPEGSDYVECQPWKESSCCTAEFTAELKRNNVEVLYNFSWNHCANLSEVRYACQALIKMHWFSFGRIFLQFTNVSWQSDAIRRSHRNKTLRPGSDAVLHMSRIEC